VKNMTTLALALLLCGCGSLQITVSVLDPKHVEQEVDRRALREELPIVLGQSPEEATQPIVDVERKHFEYLASLQEAYQHKARRLRKPNMFDAEIKSLDKSWEAFKPRYLAARSLMMDVQAKIAALHQHLESADKAQRPGVEAQIGHYLRIRRERLQSLRGAVEEEIRDWSVGTPKDVLGRQPVREAREDLVAKANSLIRGQGLVEDPYAHAVASAPDELWARDFNHVYGQGTFGNFNMAVKMEDLGDFTLKGLTFDPSDVARVASKVTTQALLLASQMAGVPTSTTVNRTGTTPVPGEALAASSKRLGGAQAARAEVEAKFEAHQEGLLAVAGTVLREWASLEDDTQRAAGIAAIKGGFLANQSRLKMEATNSGGGGGESSNGDDNDQEEEDDENPSEGGW
jgi:hypothetical protein